MKVTVTITIEDSDRNICESSQATAHFPALDIDYYNAKTIKKASKALFEQAGSVALSSYSKEFLKFEQEESDAKEQRIAAAVAAAA